MTPLSVAQGLLLALPALAVVGHSTPAWAETVQKQVLVLSSTRRDVRIAVLADGELPRLLERGLGETIDYYSDYIDQARFPDPSYETAFREFLDVKYRGHHLDLVITLQDVATEFMTRHRDELFPDTPVVFYVTDAARGPLRNATGVLAELDFTPTLGLATALQPDTKQVFVVHGASTRDKIYENLAREQFRSFETRLAFTYLSILPAAELSKRLAALPAQSIVYYLLFYQDSAGENFNPVDYIDTVSATANRPVYSWVDTAMGHGIVGGSLRDLQSVIGAVANQALRVLGGQRAESIPIVKAGLNAPQVDWRQLRRWGISETRVPVGARILFREPGVWDLYKAYISSAVALLLAQTVLIGGLLVHRAKRRHAESQLRTNQTELRTSYDRIRDLAGRLLNAQEDERSRIARELHDDISQQMTVLAIDLEFLRSRGLQPPFDAEPLAVQALERTRSVARSLHNLSHRLHPVHLRLIGLVPALATLQREVSTPEVAITLTHDDVPLALPHDLALCLFRVAQEGLQNAVKHSRATTVSMRLANFRDVLVLTITDNGVGFEVDAGRRRGLGLISMAERVELAGGNLHIRSAPHDGTSLEITVPVPAVRAIETMPA